MNTLETNDNSLVEVAQKKILEYITQQGYKLDSQLPKETELAEILGVSRVVIREALSRLRAIGVLETKRKKGTVLISPKIFGVLKVIIASGLLDNDTQRDLYDLRLMLEIGMADFVCSKCTDTDILNLLEIVKREESATTTEESINLDIEFHSYLYSITKNVSLSDFHFLLRRLFALYSPRTKDYKVKQIISHNGLIEVLRLRNPDAFRTAMRLHLNTQFVDHDKIVGNPSFIQKNDNELIP